VLSGAGRQLAEATEQDVAVRHYELNLTDSCHELTSSHTHAVTSDQQMNSYQQLTGSRQLLSNQLQQQQQLPSNQLHQQLPELAVCSEELLHGRQDLTVDGVMLHHGYMDDLCPVCNDRVSGYHYGLQTCESCKGNGVIIKLILYRVSTTPGNTGNLLEFLIPPGNTGNILEFN